MPPSFLELAVDGVDSAVDVIAFEGRERLSDLWRFDLQLRADAPTLAGWRGKRARFTFRGEGAGRTVSGVIARVRDGAYRHGSEAGLGVPGSGATGSGEQGPRHFDAHAGRHHGLRLVPALWLAKKRVRSRIFQDLTVLEIAHEVAREWQPVVEIQNRREYPRRGYCVQYRESDYAFLRRLLGEYGLSFWFESRDDGDALVIGDDPSFFARLPGALTYPTSIATAPSEAAVVAFAAESALGSGDVTLTEFDWQRPERGEVRTATVATSGAYDEARLRIDDHHQEYERWSSLDAARAEARLDGVRRTLDRAVGASFARGLGAGVRFDLHDHPTHEGAWLAIEVLHEGHIEGHAGGDLYRNRFRCVPAATRFRPKRPRRVLDQVVESAIVTGPHAEAVYVDAWGRIKVRFPWDPRGPSDERSSCWIRVLQPWAGPNWGHQFLPRVGMEVLVTFVGGDVDQPVVLGSLYNETRPEPYPLPENRTKSGIRTQSIGNAAGYNELSFEDAAGREEVALRAERNLRVRVGDAHVVDVGGAEDRRVGGDASQHIGGHEVRVIGASANLVVGGALSEAVGGAHSRVVAGGLHVDAASLAATLRGPTGATVDGPLTLTAAGLTARADQDLTLSAGRAVSLEGDALTLRGATSGELHAARMTFQAETLDVVATRLAIRCGDSVLEMDDEGVRLSGPTITIDAHQKLALLGDQSQLTLADGVAAVASSVELSGSGADLRLDGNARLRGGAIALQRNGGQSASLSRDNADATPPPKLLFSWYVGERPGAGERTALIVETPQRERLARKAASEAAERVSGHVTWALDPDDYDRPVIVFVEDDEGERHHLAGPADPRHLRDVMVAGDVAAEQRLRGAQRARPRRAPTGGGGVVIEELSVEVETPPAPANAPPPVPTTRVPLR